MNPQFCKVRKTFAFTSVLNLKELEKKYLKVIEEAYNLMHSDTSLRDFLYHEASKLKKIILNVKQSSFPETDAKS